LSKVADGKTTGYADEDFIAGSYMATTKKLKKK
jgi:hypothetical protein